MKLFSKGKYHIKNKGDVYVFELNPPMSRKEIKENIHLDSHIIIDETEYIVKGIEMWGIEFQKSIGILVQDIE